MVGDILIHPSHYLKTACFSTTIVTNSVGTSTHSTLAHTHQYGQGGGAFLSFKRDSLANIRVSFLRYQFVANQAYAGGGLSISLQGENNIQNAKVLIEMVDFDSRFEHNGCDKCAGTQMCRKS